MDRFPRLLHIGKPNDGLGHSPASSRSVRRSESLFDRDSSNGPRLWMSPVSTGPARLLGAIPATFSCASDAERHCITVTGRKTLIFSEGSSPSRHVSMQVSRQVSKIRSRLRRWGILAREFSIDADENEHNASRSPTLPGWCAKCIH